MVVNPNCVKATIQSAPISSLYGLSDCYIRNCFELITFDEHDTIEADSYAINVIPATEWLLSR